MSEEKAWLQVGGHHEGKFDKVAIVCEAAQFEKGDCVTECGWSPRCHEAMADHEELLELFVDLVVKIGAGVGHCPGMMRVVIGRMLPLFEELKLEHEFSKMKGFDPDEIERPGVECRN